MRFLVKKCECLRGTAPLQGFVGSEICSGLVTPGMKPFPAMASSTNFFRPALVSAVASSAQVVTLRQVPTSAGCAAAAWARFDAAPLEPTPTDTTSAKSRAVARPRRLQERRST
jgi:hypothetical protein